MTVSKSGTSTGAPAADLFKVQRVVATRIASAGAASQTTPTLNFS